MHNSLNPGPDNLSQRRHSCDLPGVHSPRVKVEKKRKLCRFTQEQLRLLDMHFKTGDYWPDRQTRTLFAERFKCSQRKVQVWFQNERAKLKIREGTLLEQAKILKRQTRDEARMMRKRKSIDERLLPSVREYQRRPKIEPRRASEVAPGQLPLQAMGVLPYMPDMEMPLSSSSGHRSSASSFGSPDLPPVESLSLSMSPNSPQIRAELLNLAAAESRQRQRQSMGSGRRRSLGNRHSLGSVRRSLGGPARHSVGPVGSHLVGLKRDSIGLARESIGLGRESIGLGRESIGLGRESVGLPLQAGLVSGRESIGPPVTATVVSSGRSHRESIDSTVSDGLPKLELLDMNGPPHPTVKFDNNNAVDVQPEKFLFLDDEQMREELKEMSQPDQGYARGPAAAMRYFQPEIWHPNVQSAGLSTLPEEPISPANLDFLMTGFSEQVIPPPTYTN